MKLRLILAAIAAISFTSAIACAISPTATPDEPTTNLTQQIQELQAENTTIRNELATIRSEIDQQSMESPTNNDICGRSPSIQKILIGELALPSCQLINDRELLRLSDLTVSSDELWPGDLDDMHNLETLNRDSPDQTNFPGYSSRGDTAKYNPAFQGRQMRSDAA